MRCVTSAGDSYSNIDVGEFVNANNQEGFVDLWVFEFVGQGFGNSDDRP